MVTCCITYVHLEIKKRNRDDKKRLAAEHEQRLDQYAEGPQAEGYARIVGINIWRSVAAEEPIDAS